MSTYKFKITKRNLVEQEDSSIWLQDKETFADSSVELQAQADVDVAVYLDDVSKHTVTLTDAGATLEFTADLSDGEHTIKVVPAKSPIHQTDVCVDQILVDDQVIVMTQWDFNNQILGTTSTARQKLSDPQHQPHQYVWWGTMVTNDSSYDLVGHFYRPKIVSDHQGEWHWTFTKTSSGKIWISSPGDTDDILYDSTAQHTYYACDPQQAFSETTVGWGFDELDSSSAPFIGPGTYDADLMWVDDSWDESLESADRIVILSKTQYLQHKFNKFYYQNYTLTPITVT